MTNRFYASIKQVFASILIGGSAAYSLVFYYFNDSNYSGTDKLFLLSIPTISAAICTYYLFPLLKKPLLSTSITTKAALGSSALISALCLAAPVLKISYLYFTAIFISTLSMFLAGSIPTAKAYQKIIETKNLCRLLAGWACSTFLIFISTGFLDIFYKTPIEIALITLSAQLVFGTSMYFFINRLWLFSKNKKFDTLLLFILFSMFVIFLGRFFQYGTEAPELLLPEYFLLDKHLVPIVGALSVFFIPWLAWGLSKFESLGYKEKLKSTWLYSFINENILGILLALAFFAVYLVIATTLNHPQLDVDDIFFDADAMNWRLRLTTDIWHDYYGRSVHPFVLLILKPPVDVVAILLKGNKLFSAYIVVALTGAACVFLSWKFIKQVTGNIVYAALMSSILGFSASHLVFGSLIETYIFLAASLLLFFLFLLEEKPLWALVLASLPVIGITYSNFAQNSLALFSMKPNLKTMFRYVTVVLVLLVQLSLVNNLIFPDAHPFFFIPSALSAEERNFFPLNPLRGQALERAFLFSNVVAPSPILYTGDIPFTQFRFFKPEILALSVYDTPLQTFTVWFWLGLVILGCIIYFMRFREYKTNRISLALFGALVLNFILHLRYGKELFLYSANWTYALILLLALSLQGLSKQRWLQITLLVFIYFLMVNNSWLFDTIFYILFPD